MIDALRSLAASYILYVFLVVLNKVVMVSKNLSGIKDLTGLALPILGLPYFLTW